MANKIDSNITGLRYAEEASLKTLSGTPIWTPLEPNSYKDFGGQISTVARKPINASRQLRKGVTTDLDASGGFNQDLTINNTTKLLQGFFFADIREKPTSQPMNGMAIALTAVATTDDSVSAASGLTVFKQNMLLYFSGFGVAANNGLRTVAADGTAIKVTVSENLTDEASPPSAAKIEQVGYQFASATMNIVMNGSLVQLSRVSGTLDLTTLGLIPGEWVYLGADGATNRFTNNEGFARIGRIASTFIEFDKVNWTPQAEVGTGKLIQIFFGSVLKNESLPALIKRRTYQLERTLGDDGFGTQSEYLVGAVPNELTLNIAQADKVTVDMDFVALDNEQRTGATGLKSGSRPTLTPASAFNTSSDMSRIKLSLVSDTDPAPTALFAFATEMSITLKNGVSPNKAIGVLGAFDTSAGNFEIGGKMTAYFASVAAVAAIRNNSDVTIDIIMLKKNLAMIFDIPLLALGDGRLSVEQDQPITLPLEVNAAASKFDHTFLFQSFAYLPTHAGGL